MKAKIQWTEDERVKLIREVVRLRKANLIDSLMSLVNQAQKVLPAARQRDLKTLQSVREWLLPKLTQEWELAKEVIEVPVEVVLEIPQSIKKVPTAELLTELILRFAGKLDQIERLIPTTSAPPTQSLGQSLAQPRNSVKPKVLIAGMKANQLAYVEHRLGHAVEFRFIESDASDSINLPINVDGVYLVTKFASHVLQQRLRNQYNGEVRLLTGGLTSIVEVVAKDFHVVL